MPPTTGWRAPGEDHPAPAAPQASAPETAEFFAQDVAYHRALEWRFSAGSFNAPGPAAAWTRPSCQLVEGEPMTPLEHLLVMTDAASGISATLDWTKATFANVDLTLNLQRPPAGEWLGMDAATTLGGTGAGQCFAVLYRRGGRDRAVVGVTVRRVTVTRRAFGIGRPDHSGWVAMTPTNRPPHFPKVPLR